jgi:cobalt/nickel transport system permease protein
LTAFFAGGVVSWFASKNPDGLEWAIAKMTGKEELKGPEQGLHQVLAVVQEKTALMPDYSFKKPVESENNPDPKHNNDEGRKLGTTVSGLLGTIVVLVLAYLSGSILKNRKQTL